MTFTVQYGDKIASHYGVGGAGATIAANVPDQVDARDRVLQYLAHRWEFSDSIRAGTEAFRALGQRVLPKEAEEQADWYEVRRQRAFLVPAMATAIDKLAAMPFSEPVKVTPQRSTLPMALQRLLSDVDGSGCDMTAFGYKLLKEALWAGMQPVLVDPEGSFGDTMYERRQALESGAGRVTWKMIDPRALLRLRFGLDAEGRRRVRRIAWMEEEEREEGDFGTVRVRRIFDLTAPNGMRVWESEEEGAWVEITQPPAPGNMAYSRTTKWPRLPIEIYWPEGHDGGVPPHLFRPMEEMTTLHFQRHADLGDLMAFNIPVPVLTGAQLHETGEEEVGEALPPVSPRCVLRLKQGGTFELKQADPGSLEVRIQELQEIERWLQSTGMDPMLSQADPRTATEVGATENRNLSRMAAWVRGLEGFTLAPAQPSADLVPGFEVPEDLEFGIADGFEQDADALDKAKLMVDVAKSLRLPLEVLLEQLVELRVLPQGFDVEAVSELIDSEEPEPAPPIVPGSNPGEGGDPDPEGVAA